MEISNIFGGSLRILKNFRGKGSFHPVLRAFILVQTQQTDALRFQICGSAERRGVRNGESSGGGGVQCGGC